MTRGKTTVLVPGGLYRNPKGHTRRLIAVFTQSVTVFHKTFHGRSVVYEAINPARNSYLGPHILKLLDTPFEGDPFKLHIVTASAWTQGQWVLVEDGYPLPHLTTPEFLETLVGVARNYGWDGDYVEIERFVRFCFQQAGKEPPSLEPYADPRKDPNDDE